MTLPFFNLHSRNHDEIMAVDLGGRHTKAVLLRNSGGRISLNAYTIQDSPSEQSSFSVDVLAEHLKSVSRALGDGVKNVTIALGSTEIMVRRAEMPPMPVGDMRQLLRFNSKNYLQQDFPDHVFDCAVIIPRAARAVPAASGQEAAKPAASAHQKQKVIVGGARQRLMDDVGAAIKQAGLVAAAVVPGLVGPINSFELAEPEAFAGEAVALVDLGFRNTTICMLHCGELIMHRVVNIGGDRFTTGLAEMLNVGYAEAEGIKVGSAAEVQGKLDPLVTSLGRELRAFIDFFEHQQDVAVSQVFLSGGSARSELIVQELQLELLVPCKLIRSTRPLNVTVKPEHLAELEQLSPQLAVAIGVGLSTF